MGGQQQHEQKGSATMPFQAREIEKVQNPSPFPHQTIPMQQCTRVGDYEVDKISLCLVNGMLPTKLGLIW